MQHSEPLAVSPGLNTNEPHHELVFRTSLESGQT
jgi:hypothetical protein